MTKILASVGIGVMGATLFAGCSLSEEQQRALDLVTEKADKLIELTEQNMKLANSQLSKADAAEMILLARTKLAMGLYNDLYIETNGSMYSGLFDHKIGDAQDMFPRVYFRKTDDFKYFAMGRRDGSIVEVRKADFTKEKLYVYSGASTEVMDYETSDFALDATVTDIFSRLGYGTITTDDIVNIENLQDSYKFRLMKNSYDVYESNVAIKTTLSTIEISKSGDILGCDIDYVVKSVPKTDVEFDGDNIVEGEDGMPIVKSIVDANIVSVEYKTTYKYSGIDFTPAEVIASGLGK